MTGFSLCPTCGKAVSPRVDQCPHCGERLLGFGEPAMRLAAPRSQPYSASRAPARSPIATCLVVVLVGFGGIMLLGIIGMLIGPPPGAGQGSSVEAWRIAKDLVRENLKAPSTAKFPWDGTAVKQGDRWAVQSYVDSQNSFGAMIRTEWGCILAKENGRWRCLYLKLDDQVLIVE